MVKMWQWLFRINAAICLLFFLATIHLLTYTRGCGWSFSGNLFISYFVSLFVFFLFVSLLFVSFLFVSFLSFALSVSLPFPSNSLFSFFFFLLFFQSFLEAYQFCVCDFACVWAGEGLCVCVWFCKYTECVGCSVVCPSAINVRAYQSLNVSTIHSPLLPIWACHFILLYFYSA